MGSSPKKTGVCDIKDNTIMTTDTSSKTRNPTKKNNGRVLSCFVFAEPTATKETTVNSPKSTTPRIENPYKVTSNKTEIIQWLL